MPYPIYNPNIDDPHLSKILVEHLRGNGQQKIVDESKQDKEQRAIIELENKIRYTQMIMCM